MSSSRWLRLLRPILLLGVLWAAACRADLAVRDSYDVVTPTPRAVETPTPTPILSRADGVGLAFYREWSNGNYDGMYSLLDPRTQAVVSFDQFKQRYQEAMDTARVLAVTARPLSSLQNERDAEMVVRVTWQTAVVGTIVRDHTVPLTYAGERWGVRWHEGLIMPELAGGNFLRLAIQAPPRAVLYDRGETVLAYQGTGVVLSVVPSLLQDETGFLQALSVVLGKTPQELRARYAGTSLNEIPLGVTTADVIQQQFSLLEPYFNAGLRTSEGRGRIYNADGIAPHLIGSLSFIAAEQRRAYWERGYRADERVGVTGLERAAEPYLTGTRGGQLKLISPAGEELDIVQETPAEPGRPVHATFDAALQLAVQQALADAITTHPQGHSGAIVVLDVNSGKVLAMASYPTFDPALFTEIRSDTAAALTALLNDTRRPLLNRATQGAYPPGSTFKIVTMSAGLYSGQYAADTRYFCTGSWNRLGDANIKYDWLLSGHGSINLLQALTRSCNTYSYDIGYTLDGRDPFLLPNLARQFGLGALTGVALEETAGLIPDPAWKLANLGEGWSTGDAVNMAIGQGFVLVTPLQLAVLTAAVANGGTLYRPLILDRVDGSRSMPEQLFQPEVRGQLPLSAEQLAVIQRALNDVTSGPYGTAVDKMAGLTVSTAGKTGTAQVANVGGVPHAWFTGYAPYERPEIAVAVVVENAGEGSAVAAPIFRRVIELYYGLAITRYPW